MTEAPVRALRAPVAEHVAARMAAHVPVGPVRDLLASTVARPDRLTVPPSDPVAWRLYQQMRADEAARFVAILTSPELLDRIVAREKRAVVRKALAENEHLSETAAHQMAAAAAASGDTVIGPLLLTARGRHSCVGLLMDHPAMVGDWAKQLAWKLHAAADDNLTGKALDRYGPELAADILDAVSLSSASDQPRFGWRVILRAVVTAIHATVPPAHTHATAHHTVFAQLLPVGASRVQQATCLRALGTAPVRRRLVELHAEVVRTGEGECLTVAEIVTGLWHLDAVGRSQVAAAIAETKVVVDVDVVEVFDDAELAPVTHRQLACTDAARRRLTASTAPDVAAAHIAKLPTPERVAALNEAPEEVLAHTSIRGADDLADLDAAGLSEVLLLRYADTVVESSRQVDGPLRRRLLSVANDSLALRLRPERDDVDLMLARADLTDLSETVAFLLREGGELETEQRRRLAAALDAERLGGWLLWSDRQNAPRPGDWTWVRGQHSSADGTQDASVLEQVTVTLLERSDLTSAWVTEAVDAMPLPWDKVRCPAALGRAGQALAAELGADHDAWITALRLLAGWHGTPHDLCDTVRSLHEQRTRG